MRPYLLEPEAVMKHLNLFMEGIDKVSQYTTGDLSKSVVVNNILTGKWQFFILLEDGYSGHIITRTEYIEPEVKCLTIIHFYSKTGIVDFGDMADYGEKIARQAGCSLIRFFTIRDKAMEKRLSGLGFTRGYTEFTKEV